MGARAGAKINRWWKMKVYKGYLRGNSEVMVKANSFKEVAKTIKRSLYFTRGYFTITKNKQHLRIAEKYNPNEMIFITTIDMFNQDIVCV